MSSGWRAGSPEPAVPHVVLVGLPGAGKSTVGRAVAGRLGRPFLDFDEEIERREGRRVTEVFAGRGEGHFRRLERELTEELRGRSGMILAPGGGWITNPEVVALLRPPGRIIYLRVSPALALQRLGPDRASRPLLRVASPLAELERLYAGRRALYEAADAVVDTEVNSFQQVIDAVTELASPSR